MADRRQTPLRDVSQTPPPLLLMPAGTGLTYTPSPKTNLLMPVVQSEASLLAGDVDDGEADSFVGQSPPHTSSSNSSQHSAYGLFQQPPTSSTSDPFANISQRNTQIAPPPPSAPNMHVPPSSINPGLPGHPHGASMGFNAGPAGPPPPPSGQPLMGHPPTGPPPTWPPPAGPPLTGPPPPGPPPSGPPLSGPPPMGAPTGVNYHRQGKELRYAQIPDLVASPGDMQGHGAPLGMPQPGPPPHSTSMGQPSNVFTPQGQTPSTQPQPYFHSDSQNVNLQPHLAGHRGQLPTSSAVFQPVKSHWFYDVQVEGKQMWRPFSYKDAARLEDALHRRATASGSEITVPTQGGRYDVNVNKRQRFAVYWDEEPSSVTRSSWFYKPEGATRFLPYNEQFCAKLEEEYQAAVINNVWPRRLEIDEGTILIHSPYTIEHYSSESMPDEYGTIPVHSRARCVIRGTQEFEDIDEGEPDQIDHLIFVVHGIGPICDLRFRDIRECLDDFRSVSLSLMKSHFKQYLEQGQAGRVEFLPVHWHKALHGEATGVDRQLREITLKSIPKLRHFTNDTLLDLLFYTSPVYCQQIVETVGGEMNRLHDLFLQRQPAFKGNVSLMGHSLGSQILFDLLLYQKNGEEKVMPPLPQDQGQFTLEREVSPVSEESHIEDVDEDEEEEESLEVLLERLGLSSFLETFHKEQIDLDSLTEIEESDIKEMGLPMGPRKKLQKYIRSRKEKEKKRQEAASNKAKQEAAQKILEEQKQLESEAAAKQNSTGQENVLEHPLTKQASTTSVSYVTGLAGTGQPCVTYPQLQFELANFFALGSPIAMFLTVRGIGFIGEEFRLPTCGGFFNIFHPFDPVAYRLEPLVNPNFTMKPVLMPHHKGRKRLHLELKESLSRYGADLKQKIVQSLRGTWNMINDFARAHRSTPEDIVSDEVDSVISDLAKQQEETEQASVASEDDIVVGSLNQGRRIDFVLQEKPIESFNDYLFSLAAHACYWQSEDTALMILKEIYVPLGMSPVTPGSDLAANKFPRPPSQQSLGPIHTMHGAHPPPLPRDVVPGPPSGPMLGPQTGPLSGPPGYSAGPPLGSNIAVSRGSPPPPYSQHQPHPAAPPPPTGPPPLQGFVRR